MQKKGVVVSSGLPVVPVIPPDVAPGETITAGHSNAVNQCLADLWTDIQAVGGVSSVFGRTGAVVATAGDYTPAQVGAVDLNGAYANPAFISSLAWGKITGAPAFAPAVHTHAAADITSGIIATARLGTGMATGSIFLRGDGVWAAPTPAQVGAVDASASYANPAFISSLAWGKITGAPAFITNPWASNIDGGNFNLSHVSAIGIGGGVGSPFSKLVVAGASKAYDGSGACIAAITTGAGGLGDEQIEFGVVDGNYGWIQVIKPGTAVRNLVLQPSGGAAYVGIGTVTPQINLAVRGASAAYANNNGGIFMIQTGTGAGVDERLEMGIVDGSYGWIQAAKPGTAARALVLNPVGGFVGVGGVPAYDLHLTKATGYTELTVENVGGTGDTGVILSDASRRYKLGINVAAIGAGAFNIFDLTSSLTRFSITPTGNVGIGLSVAGFRLDVNGDVNIPAGSSYRRNGAVVMMMTEEERDALLAEIASLRDRLDALDRA